MEALVAIHRLSAVRELGGPVLGLVAAIAILVSAVATNACLRLRATLASCYCLTQPTLSPPTSQRFIANTLSSYHTALLEPEMTAVTTPTDLAPTRGPLEVALASRDVDGAPL